jgi:hypothetical protein
MAPPLESSSVTTVSQVHNHKQDPRVLCKLLLPLEDHQQPDVSWIKTTGANNTWIVCLSWTWEQRGQPKRQTPTLLPLPSVPLIQVLLPFAIRGNLEIQVVASTLKTPSSRCCSLPSYYSWVIDRVKRRGREFHLQWKRLGPNLVSTGSNTIWSWVLSGRDNHPGSNNACKSASSTSLKRKLEADPVVLCWAYVSSLVSRWFLLAKLSGALIWWCCWSFPSWWATTLLVL